METIEPPPWDDPRVSASAHVRVARVYDAPTSDDGTRVLVDRLWPRGLSKASAQLDDWCRTIAPSTELRQWYGHDPERFAEFADRYRAELAEPEPAAALASLIERSRQGTLTLLTATKDPDISQAAVIAQVIAEA
jgi:uncharacterized protein YeaO (DUF488 family)